MLTRINVANIYSLVENFDSQTEYKMHPLRTGIIQFYMIDWQDFSSINAKGNYYSGYS